MYFVYLLESKIDKSWYIGKTGDIRRRLLEHNRGHSIYTNKKKPWKIIFLECYINDRDAQGREKYLKSGAGRIKLEEQLKNYLNNINSPK